MQPKLGRLALFIKAYKQVTSNFNYTMNSILYYPYINIPRTDWTIRTLLYYDNVGTIVPREYFENPKENFDSHMLELVKSELVMPIDPMRSLKDPFGFSENFNKYIRNHESSFRKRAMSKSQSKNTQPNIQKFQSVNIHGEKFNSEVFYSLEQLGLAEKQEGNWFKVERNIANLLMKALATTISKDLNMLPTTDQINVSAYLSQKRETIKKRNTILKKLIPFPETIDLKKLRKFKDQHLNLLNAFKNKIELIAFDPNIKAGTEHFDLIISELELRRDELAAKMNESKMGDIIFGTGCGLIDAGLGFAASNNTLVGILSGLPEFANTVHSALKIEKAEDIFDQSGLKYLALMDYRIRHR